ncbi:TetR/AcrR family transcriptional regulator [Desulfovibrio inopinatus]|uniref:TetR/AcrR family transcriptional regulator n=1 Tax=Desulfovibrio inopinatus TaxID=102109 RepID=UPI0006886906|nr:TetR/AcrR family transcriptional regulator [Desulfovibrio inopinatus]
MDGTLYHYFANKIELLQILQENFEKEIIGRIQSRMENCPADDWRGRMKAWIDGAVDAYFDLSELHDIVIYGSGMPFRNAMADSIITRHLAELIHEGAEAGAWHADDIRWTAGMMFYSFRGGCDEAMIGTQPAENIPQKLYDLFVRILGM